MQIALPVTSSEYLAIQHRIELEIADKPQFLKSMVVTDDPAMETDDIKASLAQEIPKIIVYRTFVGRDYVFQFLDHFKQMQENKQNFELFDILESIFCMPNDPDFIYIEVSDSYKLQTFFPDIIFQRVQIIDFIKQFCNFGKIRGKRYRDQLFVRFTMPPFENEPAQLLDLDLYRCKAIIKHRASIQVKNSEGEIERITLSQLKENPNYKLNEILVKTSYTGAPTQGYEYRGLKFVGNYQIQQVNLRLLKTWSANLTNEEMDSLMDNLPSKYSRFEQSSSITDLKIPFIPKIVFKKPEVENKPVKAPKLAPKPQVDSFAVHLAKINSIVDAFKFDDDIFNIESSLSNATDSFLDASLTRCQKQLELLKEYVKKIHGFKSTMPSRSHNTVSKETRHKILAIIESQISKNNALQKRVISLINTIKAEIEKVESSQKISQFTVDSDIFSDSDIVENTKIKSQPKPKVETKQQKPPPKPAPEPEKPPQQEIKSTLNPIQQNAVKNTFHECQSLITADVNQTRRLVDSLVQSLRSRFPYINPNETQILNTIIGEFYKSFEPALHRILQDQLTVFEKGLENIRNPTYQPKDKVIVDKMTDVVGRIIGHLDENHSIVEIQPQIVTADEENIGSKLPSNYICKQFDVYEIVKYQGNYALVLSSSGTKLAILTESNYVLQADMNELERPVYTSRVYDANKRRVLPGDVVGYAFVINVTEKYAFLYSPKSNLIQAFLGSKIKINPPK